MNFKANSKSLPGIERYISTSFDGGKQFQLNGRCFDNIESAFRQSLVYKYGGQKTFEQVFKSLDQNIKVLTMIDAFFARMKGDKLFTKILKKAQKENRSIIWEDSKYLPSDIIQKDVVPNALKRVGSKPVKNTICTLERQTAIEEELNHPVAKSLEFFLDTHLDFLPHFEGSKDIYKSGKAKRNMWRALIMTSHTRYSHMTLFKKTTIPQNIPEPTLNLLKKQIKAVKIETAKLRAQLNLRGDQKRVQIQRPMHGRSLLCITTSVSEEYGNSLRGLLMAAIHPEIGVEGFKGGSFEKFPFLLPKVLQDKLPSLRCKDKEADVQVDAPKLNSFCSLIFAVRKKMQNGIKDVKNLHVRKFIERLKLDKQSNWEKFGLPSDFLHEYHRFVIKVPYVKPGKQVILWSTFHATAGSSKELPEPKITAFVDLVPSEFLSESSRIFYRYRARHSPTDPGGGSGRGSWLNFKHMVKQGKESFGLPQDLMNKFERRINPASKRKDLKNFLTPSQVKKFKNVGYLVVDVPQNLNKSAPAKRSMRNFSEFFQNVSEDSSFDVLSEKSINAATTRKEAKNLKGDEFFYYSRKPKVGDEFNPLALGDHTRLAQGGGSLLTKNSGLGKGTTFVSDPVHLRFQFSDFIFELLDSFYSKMTKKDSTVLVVLERFRVKTTSPWKGGTHVDTSARSLLPKDAQKIVTIALK